MDGWVDGKVITFSQSLYKCGRHSIFWRLPDCRKKHPHSSAFKNAKQNVFRNHPRSRLPHFCVRCRILWYNQNFWWSLKNRYFSIILGTIHFLRYVKKWIWSVYVLMLVKMHVTLAHLYLQIKFFIYRTRKNWISTILGKSLVFQTPSEILIVSEFYTKHKNELASLLQGWLRNTFWSAFLKALECGCSFRWSGKRKKKNWMSTAFL